VVHVKPPGRLPRPCCERGTPRVFQDRFAVSAKWFHSAGFSPVICQASVM
jgi:hypothetical protein